MTKRPENVFTLLGELLAGTQTTRERFRCESIRMLAFNAYNARKPKACFVCERNKPAKAKRQWSDLPQQQVLTNATMCHLCAQWDWVKALLSSMKP
jgi:hypothetical protein